MLSTQQIATTLSAHTDVTQTNTSPTNKAATTAVSNSDAVYHAELTIDFPLHSPLRNELATGSHIGVGLTLQEVENELVVQLLIIKCMRFYALCRTRGHCAKHANRSSVW